MRAQLYLQPACYLFYEESQRSGNVPLSLDSHDTPGNHFVCRACFCTRIYLATCLLRDFMKKRSLVQYGQTPDDDDI